jgi:nitroimidazol reductase NimA-like FMN-containing flavoprotein (pyridoxamine 5'-phosphate oxidase superfamily)
MDSTSDWVDELIVTERTRLRRHAPKGSHLRADLYAVLDAGFVCHLGLQTSDGPMVLPTSYGRDGDHLYLHGSVASRSLRSALEPVPMCVAVTHIDGIVLARSVFEHAVNYRSALIYGTPEVLTDPQTKAAGLHAISEQVAPGQWGYAREPSDEELAVTTVLLLALDEASVKVRSGPPADGNGPDADRPVWAGEVPLRTMRLDPVPDPALRIQVDLPPHLAESKIAGGAVWCGAVTEQPLQSQRSPRER